MILKGELYVGGVAGSVTRTVMDCPLIGLRSLVQQAWKWLLHDIQSNRPPVKSFTLAF